MIAMTLAEIAAVVGGTVHGDPAVAVTGPAYLDSRSPVPGGLFVAMVGEHTDGHAYAATARHGAHAVLGSRPTGRPTVVVHDPVVALGRLARYVVDRVRPTVLAVTGSQGKTGTKDYLAQLLPGAVATQGNLNNELGVPLTVLRAGVGTEQLVLEMGARGVGHLSHLCDVAPPTVACVTAVGTAHVGEFGSPALVAVAKGELVEALPGAAEGGVAVLNADDPLVAAMVSRTRARVLSFGAGGDVRWRGVSLDGSGRPSFELGYDGAWVPVALRQPGAHQVANAAAAAGMALAVGEPLTAIGARLSAAVALSGGRMTPIERGDGVLVLDDSYNANPASVRAALETLVAVGSHRPGRTVAVLGEMRELGSLSASSHEAVGRAAAAWGVDVVVAIGAIGADVARGAGRGVVRVRDRDLALSWLEDELRAGDVVLVKASRAAGLEQLVSGLTGRVVGQRAG